MSEDGRAVCRTEMTEALPTLSVAFRSCRLQYIIVLQFCLLLVLTLGLPLALGLGGSRRRKDSHSECSILHYGQALLI